MPDSPLTATSPIARKLNAYLAERFPIPVNGPAILLMFSSAYLVAAKLSPPGASMKDPRVALGILVVFFFFLRLRISDEHKDVLYDRVVNPDRLVVRGVVTLGELKAVGAVGLLIELSCSWMLGMHAFVSWLAAMVWSLLMHVEFFVPEWLRARPGIYMITHMTVIPLLTFFCFACAAPVHVASAPWGLYLFALAGALATASLETTRKIRLPADEAEGVESYSSSWGFGRSLAAAGAMQLGSFGCVLAIARPLGLGPIFLGACALSLAVVGAVLWRFYSAHDRKYAGKLDKTAALYFLTLDIGLTASLWQ